MALRAQPCFRGFLLITRLIPRGSRTPTLRVRRAPGPVLRRAALAKYVERPHPNQRFHFFVQRLNPQAKIRQRIKRSSFALADNGVFGAVGQTLHEQNRHTDGTLLTL